jgi:protein gp37
MENSNISWCNNTLNFWWGCWQISKGCRLCYAYTLNKRFKRGEWGKNTKRGWINGSIKNAIKWNRKALKKGITIKVFVNSMSDTFEDHPKLDEYRKIAFETMKKCKNLEFLLLTKRSNLIKEKLPTDFFSGEYSHVHLGVTCEAKEYLHRLEDLKAVPNWGGVRWVSYEPAQEEIHTEITRLIELGYRGNIVEKMFKSARYYFRKKTDVIKEPKTRSAYIGNNKKLLEKMDEFILQHKDTKPSNTFLPFCETNKEILKEEINKLVRHGIKSQEEITKKIKKTYKNRYFIVINK